jgi:DNA invertase Pin-like site-specific DNA recombinase
MNHDVHQKVKASHLQRTAYLYVRQSSLRQVFENTESTQRQYGLREQAVTLGWPLDRIIVIDSDLGLSGASSDREGFRRLVTEVSLAHVGIVLGLEVSRLARNSADWHRLLEICALTDTLILDEDGIYDPSHFNDRLLLGLKGTMSEAELHILRARLQGGILNKARRGELMVRPPIGYAYDANARMVFDPDQQIQQAVRLVFETFRRTGSALGTVRAFRQEGLLFPRRLYSGTRKGDVLWGKLEHCHVLRLLHNPRYAGVFIYGRTRCRKTIAGETLVQHLPREQWHAFVADAHPAYISWEEHELNQRRLQENAHAQGSERDKSPAREGPALLQGLIVCGRCGRRMTVRYHWRRGGLAPDYVCQRKGIENAEPICQRVSGAEVDRFVGNLLVEFINPITLDVALAVQQELQAQLEQGDRLRGQQVERARYEAELAQRRYMRVDPDNRLVADSLEADWNQKLKLLADTQQECERLRERDRKRISEEQRQAVLQLAEDFPRVWRDPSITHRDRKRMARLLIEDITVLYGDLITLHLRCRGGATKTLSMRKPQLSWETWTTPTEIVAEVDRLLDHHTYGEIATLLNERKLRPGRGVRFSSRIIARIQTCYSLRPRYDRLRQEGMLTVTEMAERLHVNPKTVKVWCAHGLLKGFRYTDKGESLYELLDNPPRKQQGIKLQLRATSNRIFPQCSKEVQYAT